MFGFVVIKKALLVCLSVVCENSICHVGLISSESGCPLMKSSLSPKDTIRDKVTSTAICQVGLVLDSAISLREVPLSSAYNWTLPEVHYFPKSGFLAFSLVLCDQMF